MLMQKAEATRKCGSGNSASIFKEISFSEEIQMSKRKIQGREKM